MFLLGLIFALFAVSFCLILLILAVRDKSSYISRIKFDIVRIVRVEIETTEKKRPPTKRRRN